ncbi:MAG: cytochrome c [Myxococcota bacterium]
MSKRNWHRIGAAGTALGLLSISAVAVGLPWDIDMADSQSREAYEKPMLDLPEGVVSQSHVLSPNHFTANVVRGSEASKKLLAVGATKQLVQKGEEMYQIYCYPCHGSEGGATDEGLGPVAWTEAAPARIKGIPYLSGPNGVAKSRDDQWIYVTIRNGGGNMPAYGHAMNDQEMWSIVHYIRTLPDSQQLKTAAEEEAP